tara:strand:- start:6336 stop:6908 length:573 start_codon:yes stop_codon:yes gene_type:complete
MNAANLVTISRILLVPVIVAVYYSGFAWSQIAAAVLFSLASISDWLDGYLARKLDQTSEFGAFLDPVADKLLVVMALVLLTANYPSPWFVVPTAVLIGREVFISALREWMAGRNQRDLVAVGYIGKVKTTVQMIAIIVLMAYTPDLSPEISWFSWPSWVLQTGYLLLYLAAALSLWSMAVYLKSALPSLK